MKAKNLKILFILITILLVAIVVCANAFKKVDSGTSKINRNSSVDDIVYNDKVNIYFFWGNGCPHCKAEFTFLESIYNDYSKYFNIYAFEVWNNEDNANLMNNLAEKMNETVSGVPFLIIGDKTITGFTETKEDTIREEIVKQYEKDEHYD